MTASPRLNHFANSSFPGHHLSSGCSGSCGLQAAAARNAACVTADDAICHTLQPLSPDNPRWDIRRPGLVGNGSTRLVVTVAVHGNEPCGMLAVNELLREGAFDFANGHGAWPSCFDTLTVILGNPAGVKAKKRFLETNLNRLFTEEHVAAAEAASDPAAVGPEHGRVAELAAAIAGATHLVDVHSSSAAAPGFAFHTPGDSHAAYAASLPVAFTIADSSLRATTIDWAQQKGLQHACLVECGQHDARETVEVAKGLIRRLLTGKARGNSAPCMLRGCGSVKVGAGFRFRQEVSAFQHVAHGELVAQDDVQDEIRCPFEGGAYLVMPTKLPFVGEEAWVWAVEA